jgi:hypothetical protein
MTAASTVVGPPTPPPSIAPPSIDMLSPWAGNLTSKRVEPRLPASHPDDVAPPPLMLVPPQSSSSAESHGASGADWLGALPTSHRIDLLGSEASELPRVQQQWNELDEERTQDKLDRVLKEAFGGSEPLEPAKAHRHLVRIMTTSDASDVAAMREAMMDAVDEDGVFEAPLTLTHGTLRLTFDAVETLRATMGSVATYLKDNETLRDEVESAREILAQQSVAPEAAEDLTERIRNTFEGVEGLDVVTVDKRTERMLLESRAYQKKKVLGGELVRALIHVDGASMPCYLTTKLAASTPLYTELVVRLIAELHPRQDQHEKSARALRVIALGRVVARQEEC